MGNNEGINLIMKKIQESFCDMSKLGLHEGLIINTIMNNSQDTIYFKDINSKFLLNSKAHAIQFGFENSLELVGKSDFDFFPTVFASQAYADEQRIIATGEPIIGRIEKWVKPDGKITWLSASKYPLYDQDGNIIGTWGTSRDISALKNAELEAERLNIQLKEANKKLEALSVKDSLSGLYNHRHFYEELEKAFNIYSRHKENGGCDQDFSVIFIDIDYFKKTNDSFGHLMGDLAIKHIANIMLENTSTTDSCFRYGGDEFAIILIDVNAESARLTAEAIRKKVEHTPIVENGQNVRLTVSLGVAQASEATDMNDLIDKTDKKLYLSKHEGRNKVS